MFLNFDQSPVSFSFPVKTTYTDKGGESVRITNVDDKRQITATLRGIFIYPIYSEQTDRCNPTVKLPNSFHITHPNSHWSNEKIAIKTQKRSHFLTFSKGKPLLL